MRRKGIGQGTGKGYKNILGNDSNIHSQSAQGIKQPTNMNETKLDAMDNQVLANKKGFGTKTKEIFQKGYSKNKEFIQKKLEEQKQRKEAQKEDLLSDIGHPLQRKMEKQYERVRTLEKHHSEANDNKKEQLELKLEEERKQYREIQEEVTKINVQDLTNKQLEQIAIRYKDESFFGFGDSNPYRKELLRRTEFKKNLDYDVKEIKNKKVEKKEGFFDDLFD